MARPTNYTPEILKAAEDYASFGWRECGDKVPTVAGLAIEIGVSRSICYVWAKEEDKAEFLDILMRIEEMQERELVNCGLAGEFNPAITKMMMTKHGYSDKQEIDHSSADGSMSPKPAIDATKLSDSALAELMAARNAD